jgi:glycosyltransferase involved in cell wall biosynthesis
LLVTRLRILWVKAGKLLPVDTGGKIRSYNILRHLARSHQVTLLSYYGGRKDSDYESEVKRELPGAETVHTAALDGSALAQYIEYARLMFRPAPFAVTKFTHPEVKRIVESWLSERRFDVAVCDFLSASLNFPSSLATPAVLFQHNVESALWKRLASTESSVMRRMAYTVEARKMGNYERHALKRFQNVIAVSENDKEQMLAMEPSCSITVVPTGVDTQKYTVAPPATADPPKIVFLGSMDWEPNIDAVTYFCREIFPRIRAKVPGALFQIVGRSPHATVRQLASEAVEVTGTVPSVTEYLRDATVFVVPLRIGGGTRLKIFEAMASGKAVVSTTIGAEGLAVESGRDLILADDAVSFAESTVRLILDAGLRRQYEEASAKLAAQYDWSNIVQQFAAALDSACRAQRSRQQ